MCTKVPTVILAPLILHLVTATAVSAHVRQPRLEIDPQHRANEPQYAQAIVDLGNDGQTPAPWQQWANQNPTYQERHTPTRNPSTLSRQRQRSQRCAGKLQVVARDFIAVPGQYLGTQSIATTYGDSPLHLHHESEQNHEYELAWKPIGKVRNLSNCTVTAVAIDFSVRQGPKLAETQTAQITIDLGKGQMAAFTGTIVDAINDFDPNMIVHGIRWQFEDGTVGHWIR